MKKCTQLLALILALALLSGCTGIGNEPTVPTDPVVTTPTDPQPTQPAEQPTETTPTEPEGDELEGELFSVTREGHYVFSEPSYDGDVVQGLPAGTYTILETKQDEEGNTWGKLKSGMGWICLTEITQAAQQALPIAMVEAYPELLKGDLYETFELFPNEHCYKMAFFAYEPLRNVKLSLIDVFAEEGTPQDVKWEKDTMEANVAVILYMAFPGDFTTYELTFLDDAGAERAFRITQSGRNSMIVISEEA